MVIGGLAGDDVKVVDYGDAPEVEEVLADAAVAGAAALPVADMGEGVFDFDALAADRQRWQTREQLRLAIITWIERTYHRRRRLGRLTPIEYETINKAAQAA